jgi:hypothetical protein
MELRAVALALFNEGNVENVTGALLQATSVANNVTGFQRPEDGAWDPNDTNDFYFVTTASFTTASRLWRLRFEDASEPELGGTIEMLLDGSEGQRMMDNMTIDLLGRIYLQEDPGGQAHLAKIWRYDIASDTMTLVAQHNPVFFDPSSASFLTNDEESPASSTRRTSSDRGGSCSTFRRTTRFRASSCRAGSCSRSSIPLRPAESSLWRCGAFGPTNR